MRSWLRTRCHHRSRLLGLRCLRVQVYDYWCAKHNYLCWQHTMETNRCKRVAE